MSCRHSVLKLSSNMHLTWNLAFVAFFFTFAAFRSEAGKLGRKYRFLFHKFLTNPGPTWYCRYIYNNPTFKAVKVRFIYKVPQLLNKPKFHLARHVSTWSSASSRAVRQARHTKNAWARHVESVVSRRDATSQLEFGQHVSSAVLSSQSRGTA